MISNVIDVDFQAKYLYSTQWMPVTEELEGIDSNLTHIHLKLDKTEKLYVVRLSRGWGVGACIYKHRLFQTRPTIWSSSNYYHKSYEAALRCFNRQLKRYKLMDTFNKHKSEMTMK